MGRSRRRDTVRLIPDCVNANRGGPTGELTECLSNQPETYCSLISYRDEKPKIYFIKTRINKQSSFLPFQ